MMNVYQKSATVALRVGGCLMLIMGIMGFAVLLLELWFRAGNRQWFASFIWLLFGILVILLSERMGKWIGSDMD